MGRRPVFVIEHDVGNANSPTVEQERLYQQVMVENLYLLMVDENILTGAKLY